MKVLNKFSLVVLLILSLSAVEVIPNQFVSPQELNSGDKLVGLTRMAGNVMHEFELEILIVKLGAGPKTDIIWAEVKDELIAETGVLAGMSGSPVYYQGKLVGAVAYTQGYLKKPILGITPIAEMLRISDFRGKEVDPPFERLSRNERGGNDESEGRVNYFDHPYHRLPSSLKEKNSIHLYYQKLFKSMNLEHQNWSWSEVSETDVSQISPNQTTPIDIPFNVGGKVLLSSVNKFGGLNDKLFLGKHLLNLATFKGLPLATIQTAQEIQKSLASSDKMILNKKMDLESEVVPGDLIGVNLIRGDIDVSGYGTVTYISNDLIWAFGHPMSGFGVSELAIYTARTEAVVPSLVVSYKMGKLGKELGKMVQDRYSAILVEKGKSANYIPVEVSLESPINQKKFYYEITADKNYFSGFANLVVMNSMFQFENKSSTLEYEILVETEKGDVRVRNFISTFNDMVIAALNLSGNLVGILDLLENNEFESIPVKKISVKTKLHPKERVKFLKDIRLFRQDYEAGEVVKLELITQNYRQEKESVIVEIQLPEDLEEGIHKFHIGSENQRVIEEVVALYSEKFQPVDVEDLIQFLNLKARFEILNIWRYQNKESIAVGRNNYHQLPYNQAKYIGESLVSERSNFKDIVYQEIEFDRFLIGTGEFEIEIKSKNKKL